MFYGLSFSQITITTNNYLPPVGTNLNFQDAVTVDQAFYEGLKSGTGGPMNWDFSSSIYSPELPQQSYFLASTPLIDSFPTATLVIFSEVCVDSSWIVYNSTSTIFDQIGAVYYGSRIELISKPHITTPEWTFPLNYNDTWVSYEHTTDSQTFSTSYTYDTTFYNIDAFGTVQYFSNSVPCLRVNKERHLTIETYDNANNLLGTIFQIVNLILFVDQDFTQLTGASKVSFMGFDTFFSTATNEFLNISTDITEMDNGLLPDNFILSQNYPNPFNPSTEISFSVPTKSQVNLTVYDILGRKVTVLVKDEMSAGSYIVDWNGTNVAGDKVSSGMYLYKLTSSEFTETKKMILLK